LLAIDVVFSLVFKQNAGNFILRALKEKKGGG